MCLDIDPKSVIDKHLVKKITDLTGEISSFNPIISNEFSEDMHDHWRSKHNLTMLDSFHISLKVPQNYLKDQHNLYGSISLQNEEDNVNHNLHWHTCHLDILPIIGNITLAEICISEKNGKKSAWIPLEPAVLSNYINNEEAQLSNKTILTSINLEKEYDSFDHHCDEYPVQLLHISLANLTGNPKDSIARPEDCIIDTITA